MRTNRGPGFTQDEDGINKWELESLRKKKLKSATKEPKSTDPKMPKFNQGKKEKRIKLRNHQWEIWE